MAGETDQETRSKDNSGMIRWSASFWVAVVVVLAVALVAEASRWLQNESVPALGWWSGRSPDWLPYLPLLLCAPLFGLIRRPLLARTPRWWSRVRRVSSESCPTTARPSRRSEDWRAMGLSLLVAAIGLLMSGWVGWRFGDLPPAYHDEFSYLLQAETFLAGRFWFPSHDQMPELFDQVHVLNEGRFASRYFPGTGLWIAPFLALGHPWWGHHLAHSFASFLLFWIGRHLANNAVGLTAGLLLALSPGVLLFSNLLLAHHPTLVGLLIFVITFLKLRRAIQDNTQTAHWAFLASCGLTFAMLCRPMTAAGVGLPFGVWFAWWLLRGSVATKKRLLAGGAMAVPLALGFVGLAAYNHSITGNALVTPYQQYTDLYTPRHVYGFDNVVRGEQRLGPKVLENYDRWAENLTPTLAARNVGRRVRNSLSWTLGIVPLSLASLVFVLTLRHWSTDWWLIVAAILSLHLVHVPYWFEGIMGWHYVFESAPFWLLLFAGTGHALWRHWSQTDRPWMPVWWSGLTIVAVLVNLITIEPLWPARLDLGMAEVAFSRERYEAFYSRIEQLTGGRRALVLINPDPSDRHIDYVVNSPDLNTRILYGRYDAESTDLRAVAEAFPDRDLWLVDLVGGSVQQIVTR